MSNIKCQMSDGKCQTTNVECHRQCKCHMPNVKCQMSNVNCHCQCQCQMSNVKRQMSNVKCRMSTFDIRHCTWAYPLPRSVLFCRRGDARSKQSKKQRTDDRKPVENASLRRAYEKLLVTFDQLQR